MATAKPFGEWEMKTRLSNLLLNETMSDVTFLVEDPPQRLSCHKLILGLGSKVFEAMFYGKMAEKNEIRVPDVTKVGFTIMLRYLYSDTITIECQSEAFEAAYVAQKYLIKPLFRACEAYLLSHAILTPETIFFLHDEATFLDMKRLQGRCLRYISRNTKKIFNSNSFISASKATLHDILKLDLMDIDSETEVIEAIWLWGKEQCKELDLEFSSKNVRSLTKDFLKDVRFLSMKMEDLVVILEKFRLLDTSEQLAVLWNMAMPRTYRKARLPSNLCDVSRTRSMANCSRIELPTEYRYDGSLTTFSIEEHQTTAQVTVNGPQVTILGAVLTFKPIPCYSALHRSLDFELQVGNTVTNLHSSAKLFQKAADEESEQLEQVLLLEDYVVIADGETARLTVQVAGQGVRLMQCLENDFSCRCGDACITFHFDKSGVDRVLFPIKELMCVCS